MSLIFTSFFFLVSHKCSFGLLHLLSFFCRFSKFSIHFLRLSKSNYGLLVKSMTLTPPRCFTGDNSIGDKILLYIPNIKLFKIKQSNLTRTTVENFFIISFCAALAVYIIGIATNFTLKSWTSFLSNKLI